MLKLSTTTILELLKKPYNLSETTLSAFQRRQPFLGWNPSIYRSINILISTVLKKGCWNQKRLILIKIQPLRCLSCTVLTLTQLIRVVLWNLHSSWWPPSPRIKSNNSSYIDWTFFYYYCLCQVRPQPIASKINKIGIDQ